ncbi:protein kinase [Planctomonas sp. JC2975]|uniref:protein kinase domain-containing protein n=1 Tax=Planctomonas sp. JC2975 TaxID=2729626 RepID=UPI001475DC9F|nr:protein kinase [Planctomonas sp. JC2975]NNC10897.1 protein kinase [Planctomonas sp. JC2975]
MSDPSNATPSGGGFAPVAAPPPISAPSYGMPHLSVASVTGAPITSPPITTPPTGDGLTGVPAVAAGGRPPSRYTITGTLGEGGTSIVYAAVDEHLGREVAVKVFKHEISGEDSARQQGEIDVLAGLSHHGVVTLIDAGIAPDPQGAQHRYLVLERVEGSDLRTWIDHGAISPRHIAEVGYDLAEALEYVHGHGVIHRDLKPGNVLIVADGENGGRARAQLTDFGIALTSGMERATVDGVTTGTAAYLSPEQARGDDLGGASDVYSLGLVLLECHTRTLAFPGGPVQSAIARLSTDPAIPQELPEQWRMLLAAMTARDPRERPTGRELVAALRQLMLTESSRHRAVPAEAVPELSLTGSFDRITAIAARTCRAESSALGLVQGEAVRVVSRTGDVSGDLDWLCRAVAASGEPVLVEDGSADPRSSAWSQSEDVTTPSFCIGLPVRSRGGRVIAALCVAGSEPRQLDHEQLESLHDLVALAGLMLAWDADAARLRTTAA